MKFFTIKWSHNNYYTYASTHDRSIVDISSLSYPLFFLSLHYNRPTVQFIFVSVAIPFKQHFQLFAAEHAKLTREVGVSIQQFDANF